MAKARKSKSTKNLRDLRDPFDYPETRIERYLKCIKTGDNTDLPSTVNTRIERYLYCIATGDNSTLPDHPETIIELYLDAIATGNVQDLPHDPQDRLQRYLYAAAYVDSSLLPSADYTRIEKYISSILGGTTFVTEQAPYLFRVSGGEENANVKHKEIDTIVGATMAWNQQIENGNFADSSGWNAVHTTMTVANNEATLTSDMLDDVLAIYQSRQFTSGHKIIVSFEAKSEDVPNIRVRYPFQSSNESLSSSYELYQIVGTVGDTGNTQLRIQGVKAGIADAGTVVIRDINAVDLTLMLGPIVADYVYSLESGTPGAGVSWLKSYGFLTKPFYAHDPGSLQSVCVSAHKMREFNQWDEEWEVGGIDPITGQNAGNTDRIRSKNYIPVIPGATYYLKSSNSIFVFYYDGSKGYIDYSGSGISNTTITIPANCYFIRFRNSTAYGTVYKNDICINLSQADTSVSPHNGEYLPFTLHTYALDHSVTRRGIYRLDAGNKLYADGDTDDGKGTETVKYGTVDLGTMAWTYESDRQSFVSQLTAAKASTSAYTLANLVCQKYTTDTSYNTERHTNDKTISISAAKFIRIVDLSYTDAATFKAAMSGVYLVYELATPTTADVETFINPQQVDKDGTEEYIDFPFSIEDRDVEVPVGHVTQYPQ